MNSPTKDIYISVCIAAYNDEKTIESVVIQAADALRGLGVSFEIIVADDASCDQTRKILEELKSRFDFLKLILHPKNLGYGLTIKDLLYNSSGELTFTLPGDLQIPPQAITEMLKWIKDYDIVIGARKPRRDPLLRKINSFIYNGAISILFQTGLSDINSSKLIRSSVIDNVRLISDGPFIDAELCVKAKKKGFKIKEVPIEHKERLYGCPSGDKPKIMWKALKETISMIGKI